MKKRYGKKRRGSYKKRGRKGRGKSISKGKVVYTMPRGGRRL